MQRYAGKADAVLDMPDHLDLVRSSAKGASSRLQLRNLVGGILNKVQTEVFSHIHVKQHEQKVTRVLADLMSSKSQLQRRTLQIW